MRPSPAEYLQPGYNPSKLTISELTSILSSHEISVPSSRQQKQYYLDLFQELLAPLGPKILFDLENIVPSNKGIKKMATGQKLTMLDSNDNKRADFESETRSSKRIKSLLMESPSKLPIAKAKKGSPRRSAIALPAHDQDIECPKQDRFSINPTLPGVRDTVTSPAYEVYSTYVEDQIRC